MSNAPDSVPDSVTPEQLLQHIHRFRKSEGLPPRATTLPSLPLAGDQAGFLDLTMVVEQILIEAGGSNMLQMLQLASFLLDSVLEGIRKEVEPYTKQQFAGPVQEGLIAQAVVARTNADLAFLSTSQDMLHRVLAPLTSTLGRARAKELVSLGHQGLALYRRALFSDQTVESLGIPIQDFDAYFRQRFGPDLGAKR
jgi:hypothetical protein